MKQLPAIIVILMATIAVCLPLFASDDFDSLKAKSDEGDKDSQFELGKRYLTGNGVSLNVVEAYAYWKLSGVTLESFRKDCDSKDVVLTKSQTDKGENRFKELQAQIEKSKGE